MKYILPFLTVFVFSLELNMELPSGEREKPGASAQASQEQVKFFKFRIISIFYINLFLRTNYRNVWPNLDKCKKFAGS